MSHTTPATRPTSTTRTPLLTKLNHDWASRYEGASFDFGPLGIRDAAELLKEIRSCNRTNPEQLAHQDELLYGLLVAQRAGNRDAERVLVQVLLPAAARMAHRVTTLDDFSQYDRVGYAIGVAWEAIAGFKMNLRRRVHANLTMDVLHRLTPYKTRNDCLVADQTCTAPSEDFERIVDDRDEQPVEVRLLNLFTWAIDNGHITKDEVALLSRVALSGEPHKDIADSLGMTTKALQGKVYRIRQRLADAVRDEY